MKGNKKTWIYLLIVVVVLILLFAWGRSASETKAGFWEDTDVKCLPQGHQSAIRHFHPNLKIVIDGENQGIPANVGVTPDCMAEVHTHEGDGTIHVETMSARDITLGNFFEVWDRDILVEGFNLTVHVDGQEIENPEGYVMRDNDDIVMTYEATQADDSETQPSADNDFDSQDLDNFKATIQNKVITKMGQPIEGFEPQMFLSVYPGLLESDFDGVEASLGIYKYENGELTFVADDSKPIHSAAQSITDEGMKGLFENLVIRLNLGTNSDAVNKVLDEITFSSYPSPITQHLQTLQHSQEYWNVVS